ncbi:alpha/beta hydrolase [Paenibacillus sp. P25]|nr:alpha/beta hydrolase [Paenibacillus sp. P25]
MLAVAAVLVLFLIALWVLSQRGSRRMDKKARADAPGRMIRLNQGYTHVVEEGPADGTVIVLIPGATLPLWIWKDLPKTLVDKGYRVIRYDLYGRGYSDRPYGRYDQNLFVRRLHELLQALRIHRPVHLAGLAFGRLIACEFARSHPELAGRVILIGADGFGVRMTAGDRMKFWPVIGDFLMQIAGNKRLMDRLNGYTPKEELREWCEGISNRSLLSGASSELCYPRFEICPSMMRGVCMLKSIGALAASWLFGDVTTW